MAVGEFGNDVARITENALRAALARTKGFDGEEPSMGPIPRAGEDTVEILDALRESSA